MCGLNRIPTGQPLYFVLSFFFGGGGEDPLKKDNPISTLLVANGVQILQQDIPFSFLIFFFMFVVFFLGGGGWVKIVATSAAPEDPRLGAAIGARRGLGALGLGVWGFEARCPCQAFCQREVSMREAEGPTGKTESHFLRCPSLA